MAHYKVVKSLNIFVIEDKEGSPLIGNDLPTTKEDAARCLRIANMAYEEGRREGILAVQKEVEKTQREIKKILF
jgi:hypothetical protein